MRYNYNGSFKLYVEDEWKNEHLPLLSYPGLLYPEVKYPGYRYFDYFTYNGNQYNINTIVRLSKDAKKFLGAENYTVQIVQHEITHTNQERWAYTVRCINGEKYHAFTTVRPEWLIEEIVTPAVEGGHKQNKVEYYKDNQVDGVLKMWVMYVIAMVVATLFNDRIMLWAIFSCVFFEARKNKLKKPPEHNYDI